MLDFGRVCFTTHVQYSTIIDYFGVVIYKPPPALIYLSIFIRVEGLRGEPSGFAATMEN